MKNPFILVLVMFLTVILSCEEEDAIKSNDQQITITEIDLESNANGRAATCVSNNPGFTCNSSEGICGPVQANECDNYTYQLADYLKAFNCTNVTWSVSGGQVVSYNNTSVTVNWDSGTGGIEAFGCWPYVGIDLGVNVNLVKPPKFAYNLDRTCLTVTNPHCQPRCINLSLTLASGAVLTYSNMSIDACKALQFCCCSCTTIVSYSYTYC